MFAWCPKCYDEMEEKREGRPNTKGGQQKRTRVKDPTTEGIHDLKGGCERTHTMEEMKHCVWNENTRDVKRNRKKRE